LLGQKAEQGVVLVLSGAILVLINPRNYSSISFQLSFLATFGMIYLVPSLESAFEFLPKWLKNSVLESLGAMIVTTPVILNSFGKISIISFVANLLVIEVLNLIMKVGIWVVLLPEKLFLIKLFASVCWIFLEYFVSVVEVLAQFKYAVIDFGDTPGYVSLVIYLSVGFFVLKFFPAQAPLTSEEKMEYLIVS
jgi:competence protein ComEC